MSHWCVFARSGLLCSNRENPAWPSQVRPVSPASGAARLLSTQALFTVAAAVTFRARRTAALVESGSASTLTLGASLFSKILRDGDPPWGLREGSHVLSSRCDPRRQWGVFLLEPLLLCRLAQTLPPLRGPCVPHLPPPSPLLVYSSALTPRSSAVTLLVCFLVFIYSFIFFGCTLGHVGLSVPRLGLEPVALCWKRSSCLFKNLLSVGPWLCGGRIDYKQQMEFVGLGVEWGHFIVGCGGVTGLNEVAQTHRTLYPKG